MFCANASGFFKRFADLEKVFAKKGTILLVFVLLTMSQKYPEFVGDKRVLQDKISALNKAKDHEVALQRLVPVVSSSKEKKQVLFFYFFVYFFRIFS